MAKVVCESCGTSFLYNVVKELENCPVCGKPLWSQEDDNETSTHDEEISFGEGIELGENDSFDEDKIDFWWYEIDESDDGNIYTTCAKCNHLSFAPYPIARTRDFMLIDSRFRGRCTCGNEMKNHILSKRPEDWTDSRQHDLWKKDYENIPKCPICGSSNIKKISMTNKAVSALTFGVLAAGHVSKTYKCEVCGSKF